MADSIQTRYPRLWTFLQFWMGGTVAKRRLALQHFRDQRRVLEIGCATGNLTPVFARRRDVEYTGVDIDSVAITLAKKTFAASPRVRFLCEDLRQSSLPTASFDYVILAGVLHHVDDALARELVEAARRLLSPDGVLVVSEPLQPLANDGWLLHQFLRVEQGEYVRTGDELAALLGSVAGIAVLEQDEHLIAATPVPFPKVARFGVYRLAQTGSVSGSHDGSMEETPAGQKLTAGAE